jgi:hypothetical protein
MDSRLKRAGMTIEREACSMIEQKRVRFGSLQKAANSITVKVDVG